MGPPAVRMEPVYLVSVGAGAAGSAAVHHLGHCLGPCCQPGAGAAGRNWQPGTGGLHAACAFFWALQRCATCAVASRTLMQGTGLPPLLPI